MSAGAVPRLSGRTRAALASCLDDCYTHSQIGNVFIQFDVREIGIGNKLARANSLIEALDDPDDGERVLELARTVLEERFRGVVVGRDGSTNPFLKPLLVALRGEGYELVGGRLIAVGAGPSPVAEQVSLLEAQLSERGLPTAARHYRQAIDNFTDNRLEACNGQLRSCLENVLIELAARHGKSVTDPKAAVDALRSQGCIDGDETKLLQGLAGVSNKRGAHHGATNGGEATFRLHMTTATLLNLLTRVPDPD